LPSPRRGAAASPTTANRIPEGGSVPDFGGTEESFSISRVLLGTGAGVLALWAILEAGLRIITHSDLWWAMAAGRHVTRTHEVPTRDIFSYTFEGRPWINMEWLTQVLYYNVYENLGENAITLLRIGIILIIFSLSFWLCRERTKNVPLSLLLVAFGAWVCQPFLDTRPQLFTFLYSLVYLVLLHLFRRRQKRWTLFIFPLVMLLWCNQHYGYIFGALLLAGNVGAEILKRGLESACRNLRAPLPEPALSRADILRLASVTVVVVLVMLINPWGTEAWTHPFELTGETPFLSILEWRPPVWNDKFSPWQFWPYLTLAGIGLLAVPFLSWRRFDLNDTLFVLAVGGRFALYHRRFIPLLVVLSLPTLAFSLQVILDRLRAKRLGPATLPQALGSPRWWFPAAGVLGWVLAAAVVPFRAVQVYGTYGVDHRGESLFKTNTQYEFYPEDAVRFIREVGLQGPMYNLYNWGGYLMYFLPEHKVYTDGRAQTVYTEEHYLENLTIHHAQPGWRQLLDGLGVNMVLISLGPTNGNLRQALSLDPSWKWIYAHGFAALFVRVCPENEEVLARYERRELPLPEEGITHALYGRAAWAAKNDTQAVEDFRKAVTLSPDNTEFHRSYIYALGRADRVEEAWTAYENAHRLFPDDENIEQEGIKIQILRGGKDSAYEMARSLYERRPDLLAVVELLILADARRGYSWLEDRARKAAADPRQVLAFARASEMVGQGPQALDLYRQVVNMTKATDPGLANRAATFYRALADQISATAPGSGG